MATCRLIRSHRSSYLAQINFRRWKSQVARIDKLLIANRGEIACRVMKTAKMLGIRSVAVYSDADVCSRHTFMADEAYNIGPAAASQSYLRGEKLIEVAKMSGCQAIHPGYGFLSENAEFAQLCSDNGVIFVGPPPSAIRDMGIKSTAKQIMLDAGVPVIEGYHGQDQSDAKLKAEAQRIGYPLMVKAVRGGGGKGMRVVQEAAQLMEALDSARMEATKAFGDSDLLLEQFVQEPRHVEVQVFADKHGNAVYLFERDCSVQRRHQKIIEEAPAPGISWDLRKELGLAGVRAALAVGYVGAGTVEFILDRKSHKFHFMEMNTRLQVEHPITEMITGTDLVEWQLRVAAGEKLPVDQDDVRLNGHSFEARIYAENPRENFLPGSGPLLHLDPPEGREDVRVETGVRQGDEVSVHYDPMIAKLVVWGKDRAEALAKLDSNLINYNIAGLETNINFLIALARNPKFKAGDVHTNFIRDENDDLFPASQKPNNDQVQHAAFGYILAEKLAEMDVAKSRNDAFNPFVVHASYRVNLEKIRTLKMKLDDQEICAKIKYLPDDDYEISLDDKEWIALRASLLRENNTMKLTIQSGGKVSHSRVYVNKEHVYVFNEHGQSHFVIDQPLSSTEEDSANQESSQNAAFSPMPGILDRILVQADAEVKKGDPLCVVVAMKMEHVVRAAKDCRIEQICKSPGDKVDRNEPLIRFRQE